MLRVLLSLFLLSAFASSSAAQTHFHHVHLNSTDPRAAIEFYTTHLSGEKAIVEGAEDMKAAFERHIKLGTTFQTHAKAVHGAQLKGRTQYATNRLEIVDGRPQQPASATASSQPSREILPELPAFAATRLSTSLSDSKPHAKHVWRDTPPLNEDGTVNGYIEIARGDRNKWEFNMAKNAREIDRVIPENIGGYPVNYGFVPQTVSYDGDPFDILVLGPPIEGGILIRGGIVGLLLMNDEKGYDAKVIVSPLKKGRPEYALTARVRQEIADYFKRYKLWERDKFSEVPGWGTGAEGLSLIQMTHAFFLECRQVSTTSCRIAR